MRRLFESTLVDLAPDVIHAHDLVTLPVAGVAARRTGARLIYDAHELEVHRNTRSGPYDKIYRYLTERRHIRAADAVVTVSDSIARHLARAYSIPLPAVVMNAADGTLPAGYERDLRTDLALPRDTPLAVYVGRITVGRGLEQTVAALAHWPELHLALLGTQHPSTAAAVRGAMRRLGVADRVHFMDPVPPHAVAAYVATADVSVVPIQNICLSYYYCLPNKLIESTLAGVPVVVSNLPELRRFVEFGNSGVVMDQTDPRDIARALRAAYADRDRIRPSADRLARILEVYGWDRQREVLCDIYRRFGAVATSSPRAPDGLRRNDRLGTEIRAER